MEIKPAMVAIAAFVVITVIAAVLMPVLGEATKTEDTFTNTGLYYMTDIADGDSYEYIFDGTKWTVNGELLTFPTGFASNVLVTDSHFVRSNGQIESTSIASCDLVATNGSVTGSYVILGNTTTVNWTTTTFYGAVPTTADYITTDPNATTYVKSDTEVVGFGVSAVDGQYPIFHITGDMSSVTVTSPDTGVTIENVQINKTEVSGHEDLYTFQSITFDATKGGTTSQVTYNRVIVPTEVTAERSVHLTDSENAILLVIPALLIIAIIIGVLAVAMRGRE